MDTEEFGDCRFERGQKDSFFVPDDDTFTRLECLEEFVGDVDVLGTGVSWNGCASVWLWCFGCSVRGNRDRDECGGIAVGHLSVLWVRSVNESAVVD